MWRKRNEWLGVKQVKEISALGECWKKIIWEILQGRFWMFMFGVHPGVLFNDSWAGRGVSASCAITRWKRRGWKRVGVPAALHSNQFVMAVHMDQSYYHLRWGTPSLSRVRVKAAKPGGRWACSEETQANEDGWSHGSERRGFKMIKAFGFPATMQAGKPGCAWISYVTWRAVQRVPWLSKSWHIVPREHALPSAQASPYSLCVFFFFLPSVLRFNLLGNYLFSSFSFHQQTIYSHPFPCPSPSDTWPGVSMRGIL